MSYKRIEASREARLWLDEPKHSNAILFERGVAGLALLFSPSPALS